MNISDFFTGICMVWNWQEKLTNPAEIAVFCLKGLSQHG
tara:strand:+ start:386 stop:502 length:117 start_codon:yes stop_codon:yes gene_type:complete